jgi:hypothetical protein
MEQSAWGQSGEGFVLDEELFCCRGCADGTGCTCAGATAAGEDTATSGGEGIAGKEELAGQDIPSGPAPGTRPDEPGV